MLQLGSRAFDIDGVTVFHDHADPHQFWYLATQVALGKRPDGSPAFSLIHYKPAVAEAGVEGGGFLMLQTVVILPDSTRSKILGRLASMVPDGEPQLAAAPVERGTVRCLALNLEGPGGTAALPALPGAFNAVEKILGATSPSLIGEQTAAFSLVLDHEGAIILKGAFEKGATPIGVIYELEYSALTPDMHIEITADLDRVYNHFSAGLEAQIYWVKAGIDAGFEKLVQDGAIRINVTDFGGNADTATKEKWALDFFKDELLKKWFEPSLDLGQLKGPAQPEGLDPILERVKRLGSAAPGGGAPSAPGPVTPPGTPPAGGPAPAPATLNTTQTTPEPLPAGTSLLLVPGAMGTAQRLRVIGPPGAVLTVDGVPRPLDALGTVTVEVAPGSSHPVTVDWPSAAPLPAVSIRATLARAATTTAVPGALPTQPGGATPVPSPSAPGTATGSGVPALVSFRLRFVEQQERKTLTFIYDRKHTVRRTYAPQGFVGLLLDELADKSRHLVEVDLDDPFFHTLGVDIVSSADFEKIGLFSTDVAIDYGDPADARGHAHGEFRLTAADPGPKRFETFLDQSRDLGFRVSLQHNFDAGSPWIGEKLSYDIGPRPTMDRTLRVDAAEDLGFLELELFPNRIDEGIVDAIDVELSYDDSVTFRRNDVLRVLPKGGPQVWRLRLTRPNHRSWTATFRHHLKNGTVLTTGPLTSEASFLPVNDPFMSALDITAVPLFTPGSVALAFLDVDYQDPANSYTRHERLEIPGTATAPVPLHIALLNPAHRSFRHRVTLVMTDGSIKQAAPVDGEETLIPIQAAV
ncbi:hypothetical protein [Streptomyces sp. NPDC093591]|uniref:hypothetical protein n=1 Tax=Streptomyces sp. NPDC093591 TaxID=3366044 RepID=UPI0038043746